MDARLVEAASLAFAPPTGRDLMRATRIPGVEFDAALDTDEAQRAQVRRTAIPLLLQPVSRLQAVRAAWQSVGVSPS